MSEYIPFGNKDFITKKMKKEPLHFLLEENIDQNFQNWLIYSNMANNQNLKKDITVMPS